MNSLRKQYLEALRPKLGEILGAKNIHTIPELKKITVNVGSAEFKTEKESLEKAKTWLSLITGQAPKVTKARLSIAGFNVREGDSVGATVTLRGDRMYDFCQKLVTVVLPQIKDFQGVPLKSFDGRGGYTVGLAEQIIFPEVEYDKIGKVSGLSISFTTSAHDSRGTKELLTILGMPFAKDTNQNNG